MYTSKYFNVGRVAVTHRINAYMNGNKQFMMEVYSALTRYCKKDWGDLSEEDKEMNEDALITPQKYPPDIYLMGAYRTCEGKIWIITDRASETPGDNVTTVLFPDER